MAIARMLKNGEQMVRLDIDGKTIELPVIVGTEDEKAVDISKLRAATGVVTYDNGYMNTAPCLSAITYLDGENGILKYRGYPIEDLAENGNFLEIAYLLIYGSLPKKNELDWFSGLIASHSETRPEIKNLIKSFPQQAHPMGVLSAAIVAMSGIFPQFTGSDPDKNTKDVVMTQLMAQMKNIAALSYRWSKNKAFVESKPGSFDYCTDFLNMMFAQDGQHKPDPVVVDAINILLILHADHEQNCSTSTVRLVGSSKANLYASIASGVNALWGPLHGGANQAVIEMLESIHKEGGDYRRFLTRAKDKNDTFRLMGFGHRVYKNFDPRAKIIKSACDKVLKKMGLNDPLLDIAKGLEEEALKDSYFVERKLYPNVDFYSGIIYKALSIPSDMFTVMFALGRLPGWMAQWKEMTESADVKIGRPRQIYTGNTNMKWVPLNKR